MCRFKKHPMDESDDDEEDLSFVTFEEVVEPASGSDMSDQEDAEPVAGPSSVPDDSDSDYDPECEPSDSDEEEGVPEEASGPKTESDEELDPLVEAMLSAKDRPRHHPPHIEFKNHLSDLSFHPGEDVVAVASVSGDVFLYKYSLEQCELIKKIEAHSKACRAIEFGENGDYLVSCGTEKSIMVTDVSSGKLNQFYDDAHEDPPYCLYILNENVFCSGDEGGVMKVWDTRLKKPVNRFKVTEEQISSIISNEASKYIVCCSADCITSYDFAAGKLFVQSEPYETELTSMGLFKQEQKLVVGTMKGRLYIFNWGQFGFHSDCYPGPKHNINTMLPITENIMATGCGDGVIRAANLFPHRQLGVVGQHKMSVEATDISHDGNYIASIGFDETVRFWDISYFESLRVNPTKSKKTDAQNNLPSSKVRNPGDFFAGLSS